MSKDTEESFLNIEMFCANVKIEYFKYIVKKFIRNGLMNFKMSFVAI